MLRTRAVQASSRPRSHVIVGLTITLMLLSVSRGHTSPVPPHAVGNAQFWMCENGYRREGDECTKVFVPPNAHAVGDRWMCMDGFRREGDRCVAFEVPEHARALGDRWYCNDGFRKAADACVPISVPEHARAIGSHWVCVIGYKKSGEGCAEMSRGELLGFTDHLSRELGRTLSVCESLCEEYAVDSDHCEKRCRGE